LFYVAIILTVNAMLDLNQSLEVKVVAKAMLSLLSVVAAVIIALRSQHRWRLQEIAEAKAEQKREREKAKYQKSRETQDSHETASKSPRLSYDDYVRLNQSRNGEGPLTAEMLISQYGIPRSTAFRWQHDYREAHPNHA
jgi:hypothetical protein